MEDFVFTTLLRVTILLALATVATILLRFSSAALRHGIWAAALIGCLLLPVLALAPGFEVLPQIGEPTPLVTPLNTSPTPSLATQTMIPTFEIPATTTTSTGVAPLPTAPIPWFSILFFGWAAIAALFLARLAYALFRVGRLARHARLCDSQHCVDAMQFALTSVGTSRTPTLLTHAGVTSPMTWGIREPVVVLPTSAESWSADRLRAVLTHECAHVARCDFFVQLIARFTRALYWFHPLAWHAMHRLHVEQERACDDHVLNNGMQASSYAEDLLTITKEFRPMPDAALVSTAISRHSELVQRMRYLLDGGQVRRLMTRRVRLALTLGAALVCAAVGMSREASLQADAIESTQQPDQDPKQDPEKVALAKRLVGLLDLKSHHEQTVLELSKIGKPAIPFLVAAISDSRPEVARGAIKALAAMEDKRAVAPHLIENFRSHNDQGALRELCLDFFEHHIDLDPKIVDVLIEALSTENSKANRRLVKVLGRTKKSSDKVLVALAPLYEAQTGIAPHAISALSRLDPDGNDTQLVFAQALNSDDSAVVRAALLGMRSWKNKAPLARKRLDELAADNDSLLQGPARQTLYELGLTDVNPYLGLPMPMPTDGERQYLICDYGKNRISMIDEAGKRTFAIEEVYGAWDAEALSNGNLLITELALNRVKEIDRQGKEVWRYEQLRNPFDADRLDNGNTLIADTFGKRVIEVNHRGKIVWSYSKQIKPYDVERLANGNTLIADGRKDRILVVTAKGETVREVQGLPGIHDVDALPDGGFLVTQRTLHRVVRVDSNGEVTLLLTGLASPSDADRLPDGNILVAENGRISLWNPKQKLIWQRKIAWAVEVNVVQVRKNAKGGR